MSTAAKGRSREYAVRDRLRELGYYAARGPGSKGNDLEARYMGDAGLPNVIVECGGKDKGIASSFRQLREKIAKGQHLVHAPVPIVARCVKRIWQFHFDEDGGRNLVLFVAIQAAKEGRA